MQVLRQAGSGLIYALISVVLVLGSLSVALAERGAIAPAVATATSTPSAFPSQVSGATETELPSEAAASMAPTGTSVPVLPSATRAASYPTLAPTRRVSTATHAPSVACGPFSGWVKAYVVQPGDSMFHIAVLYGTTVTRLQQANCKTSYLIFAGERLWVPNVATASPGVTIIPPFFDTPTNEPTQVTIVPTPAYFTPTAAPIDTNTPADP